MIERASPSDRAFLAMDTGQAPEQFGVVLMFKAGAALELSYARRLIAERIVAVPRMRQRLTRVPLGCGGPIWVDDPGFDIRHHVRAVRSPEPGDEAAVLSTALSVVMTPLPRVRPLWSAVVVTGLAQGASALVLVMHHALADGIGGLAMLASLVDAPAGVSGVVGFPRPAPSRASLAYEAFTTRLGEVRHAAQSWQLLRKSMGAGGGLRPPRATPWSLNRRTGPDRTGGWRWFAPTSLPYGRLRIATARRRMTPSWSRWRGRCTACR